MSFPIIAATLSAWCRGEGSWIWDAEGNRYLDFFPGWGCNLLGHCPPRVVEAVREQVGQLIHVPNTWYMEAQGALAEALAERSFGGQSFFCNSGAEANEAAIKLARAFGHEQGRFKIVTMEGGFHGRTYAALTATAQPKYHVGFEPMVPGFRLCSLQRSRGGGRRCSTTRRPRFWSSRSRGRGESTSRRAGYLAGLRQVVRRARRALDSRRGPDRHGPDRRMVCLPARRGRARHPDLRQGPGRRASRPA